MFPRVLSRVLSRDFGTQTKQDILVLNAGSSSLKFNLFSVDMEANSVSSVLNGAANGNLSSFKWITFSCILSISLHYCSESGIDENF